MQSFTRLVTRSSLVLVLAFAGAPSRADVPFSFNNLTPNNSMAAASRPATSGKIEIEAADDFLLDSQTTITGASFTGLLVGGSTISQVVVEIYRVFPADSNSVRTPNVPTRANSPSDVAFDSRDSAVPNLSFLTSVVSPNFTALNSVLNGIHASPNQTTMGEGAVAGSEVQFDVTFTTPFSLPAGHYFFVPQVAVSEANGNFYWLSASRPITGAGTTPFSPDLQSWIRDANLDPDWLRIGTDIVGGTTPPTFNAAFSLTGTAVATPTPTATETPVPAPTSTPTATPTAAPSSTPTVTPTAGSLGRTAAIPALSPPGLALLTLLLAASALALTLGRRP